MGKIQYPSSKLNIPQFELSFIQNNEFQGIWFVYTKPLNAVAMTE